MHQKTKMACQEGGPHGEGPPARDAVLAGGQEGQVPPDRGRVVGVASA